MNFSIENGYSVKDLLKKRSYSFQSKQKAWVKTQRGSLHEAQNVLTDILAVARAGAWTVDLQGPILKELEQIVLRRT